MARVYSIYSGLLGSILVLILLLAGGILIATAVGTSKTVDTLSASVIDEAAVEVDVRLRGFFDPPVQVLHMGRRWGEQGFLDLEDPDRLTNQLSPILAQLPQVSSLLLADENGREFMLLRRPDKWRSRQTRPDLWTGKVRIVEWPSFDAEPTTFFEETDYDPRQRPWYQGAAAAPVGTLHWTAPYVFQTTKQLGITASVSFLRNGVKHVIGFDVLLDDLSSFTRRISSGSREVFVLTEDRKVVAYPARAVQAGVLGAPDELGLHVLAASTRAVAEEMERKQAPVRFEIDGNGWWGAQRPFRLGPDHRLVIAVVTPESALTADLTPLRLRILFVTVVVLGVAVWLGVMLARQTSGPIEALVKGADRIRKGDLEHPEPVPTRVREFRKLARAQDKMRSSLKTLMKMERDLQVARQIQQSTFPRDLPQPANFEIEAWSEPADETGGDTYDVLGIGRGDTVMIVEENPDAVLALLADATGHGIGPALSVTQVRAMLRMGVRSGVSIGEILHRMNEQLCDDLEGGRFITVWMGELHPTDYTVTAVSAGQGPIMHYRAKDDAFDIIKPQGPPLGVLPDLTYEAAPPLLLEPGDLYAVFSDGIYEARGHAKEIYGEERVQAVLREHRKSHVHEILQELKKDLERFTGGAPAEDDQTVILIKRV